MHNRQFSVVILYKYVWFFAAFYDGIKDVIDADGRIAEEEVSLYIDLQSLLKILEIEKWDRYHDEPYPY